VNHTFILAAAALLLYCLYLSVKGVICLYRNGEKKLFIIGVIFLIGAPLLVWSSSLIPENKMNIWLVLPLLGIFVVWLFIGFFIKSYLNNKEINKKSGKHNTKPVTTEKKRKINYIKLLIALVLWCIGVFIGIPNKTVNICLLCICLYCLSSSISYIWRSRGF